MQLRCFAQRGKNHLEVFLSLDLIFLLHNLITVQPPCSTRSSSVVTLSRPPTIFLKITDRSFRLWNQLPESFRQTHHSCLDSPPHPLVNTSLSSSPLSSSITPSLFHSTLKTYLFNNLPTLDFFYLFDCLRDNGTGPDLSSS